jgi:hypothetical protein
MIVKWGKYPEGSQIQNGEHGLIVLVRSTLINRQMRKSKLTFCYLRSNPFAFPLSTSSVSVSSTNKPMFEREIDLQTIHLSI